MPIRHKLYRMDLRHLRTFVTVAEQGTVSKASLHLLIAQPALSRQISDLENDLGVKLFDRVRRRLILRPKESNCSQIPARCWVRRNRSASVRKCFGGVTAAS